MEKITLVGIGVTFIIGILNLVYSVTNSKTTRFINTVTNSRIDWISQLRESICEYIAMIPIGETDYIKLLNNKRGFSEKFKKKQIMLQLMLNKNDEVDKEIINQVNFIAECINQYYTLLEIYMFRQLEQYGSMSGQDRFDIKMKIIGTLSDSMLLDIKENFLEKLEINDESENNEMLITDPIEVVRHCEYSGMKVIDDIYRCCIDNMVNNINKEIEGLLEKSQILLKDEWDRVKKESKKGKDIVK